MKITLGEAAGISLLGFAIVFSVLVILMCVIFIMSAVFRAVNRKTAQAPAAPASADSVPAASVPAASVPARGSCGEVSLFEVPDKTAAMVMAIVAEELGAPLNELRFISIREVEDDAK